MKTLTKKTTKTVSVKQSNEAFNKATNAEKRVMIAEDVLAQIKAKRYKVTAGIWVVTDSGDEDGCPLYHEDESRSVQELFKDKTIKTCDCCALGGLFMSCINLNNTTTVKDFNQEVPYIGHNVDYVKPISNGLNKFFESEQLKLIERYFEGKDGYFGTYDYANNEEDDNISAFMKKYPNDQKRLEAIMKNIVKNKGTFIP